MHGWPSDFPRYEAKVTVAALCRIPMPSQAGHLLPQPAIDLFQMHLEFKEQEFCLCKLLRKDKRVNVDIYRLIKWQILNRFPVVFVQDHNAIVADNV